LPDGEINDVAAADHAADAIARVLKRFAPIVIGYGRSDDAPKMKGSQRSKLTVDKS
jgi:hypothetical protein